MKGGSGALTATSVPKEHFGQFISFLVFIRFHIFSQEESEVFFSSFDIISPLPYLLYYDFLCLL